MTIRDYPTTGPGAVPDPEVAAMLTALDAGFPDVAAMSAADARAAILARRGAPQRLPDLLSVRDVVVDGPGGALTVRVYRPHDDGPPRPVIVFAHGGGFVFCDLDSHDEFCRSMAVGVGAVVVAVDYRLAPEHPGPAAHDDMLATVRWAAEHIATYGGDPARIALAGDSAGGNLAATVALAVRDGNGPPVAAQILLYPVIDDDFDTESYRRFGTGHYNTTRAMRWYWQQYAPHGTDDVRLVPTRAETLAGVAPAVVVTAELDPPCSAGDAYAARLKADGVPVHHRRYDGLFHGFLTIPSLAATQSARTEIWAMIRETLGLG
ncbi:alpha/beta hydrolase [Nocardia rosealba]|uniref:alpha/beta hydrolase n=1 Tax=Nocardia rosealba TaxID=2878563 RepID=UPI001CDA3C27|nr:alpha/beta hydrolase [Nocardia rosealba]MCA2210933.1 alpha/beta hydrolase [Nocardia rosealba]